MAHKDGETPDPGDHIYDLEFSSWETLQELLYSFWDERHNLASMEVELGGYEYHFEVSGRNGLEVWNEIGEQLDAIAIQRGLDGEDFPDYGAVSGLIYGRNR